MIFTILCGLILVDEDEEYSTEGLGGILVSVALMIAGILVLFCKNNLGGAGKSVGNDGNKEANQQLLKLF